MNHQVLTKFINLFNEFLLAEGRGGSNHTAIGTAIIAGTAIVTIAVVAVVNGIGTVAVVIAADHGTVRLLDLIWA